MGDWSGSEQTFTKTTKIVGAPQEYFLREIKQKFTMLILSF
jgi:hypothetical protein